MKWTGLNELRKSYLEFFESKGHTALPSFSLVPQGDKSILLINAGMTPLKKYFSGQETPPNTRLTTCQKCIRTPDIENVGKTARHGTYFEMLGNFSFGDYFKKEAIAWAWEYFTKILEIPQELLYVSVYEEDDEAETIWLNDIGLNKDHVVRMGKADNFWEHGQGPCGPCTEIYFDRGAENGCGSSDCKVGCDCDRYVEVWNVVFSQFNNDGKGNYSLLKNKNIDTGMGLERLACVMQGVDNIFMVDTVKKILEHVTKISNKEYGKDSQNDISIRVITDHIRSTTFMVSDGVVPQNEGRGYVLRRLLRRAARHGKLLGINQPFLYKICNTVIEENKSAYPELEQKADYIKKVIKIEEERFEKTIGQGIELLTELIDKIDSKNLSGDKILNGADAFKLYDTFGFPIDLTKEIIAERNICLDEEKFISLMNEQKTRARASSKKDSAFVGENSIIDTKLFNATAFCGYDSIQSQGKIITMADENEEKASANEGENIFIILDKTPFYAQSGGQISDTGIIETENAKITVFDVEKTQNGVYIHSCFVESGSVFNGDIVQSKVNEDKRTAVMRNHTAAHLLQKALNNVLGSHVHQAGQLVDEHRVRFDFNHFSAVNSEELKEIELTINKKILACLPVVCKEMPIEEAKLLGATALFGEKYGDMVRVVDIGGYSMEFCGGTHAHNTGSLGLFKIISESSVAAGVRRIEGVTGFGVLNIINDTNKIILDSAAQLKLSNPSELAIKVASLCADVKTYEKEINKLEEEIADVKFGDVFGKANDICGFKLLVATFTGMKSDALRKIGDKAREKNTKAIAIISTINEGKSTVLCVCGKEALEAGVDANKIVKAITAVTGGGGGGKPDCAMAGIKDQFKLDEAMVQIPDVIRSIVQK